MLLYYLYVICLFTKIITKNLQGKGMFLFLVTKLATYGSNFCHSANIENRLLAVGWHGVKMSTVKRGSSVHASPSFVCQSVCLSVCCKITHNWWSYENIPNWIGDFESAEGCLDFLRSAQQQLHCHLQLCAVLGSSK